MIIGLDKERLVFQHIYQQVFCCVHNGFYIFILQAFKDLFVNIRRHTAGNASRKDYRVSVGNIVYFVKKQVKSFAVNFRTLTVKFCLRTRQSRIAGLYFHVYS